MSWHVQRQSSKLVGSAQRSSEHSNWQLLASSLWHFASFFLVSLYSNLFLLSVYILLFRHTKTKSQDLRLLRMGCHRFKMTRSHIYGPLYCRCLKMYDDKMLTWGVYTTCTDLYDWQSTFKLNHVLATTSPESVTAASKMRISCFINLLSGVCHSCLHDWLLTSVWNHCWSELKNLEVQAICADPQQPVNPDFCVSDRFSIWHVLCKMSSSKVTALCSFLCRPRRGSHVCDRGSVLRSEPSSHYISKALKH